MLPENLSRLKLTRSVGDRGSSGRSRGAAAARGTGSAPGRAGRGTSRTRVGSQAAPCRDGDPTHTFAQGSFFLFLPVFLFLFPFAFFFFARNRLKGTPKKPILLGPKDEQPKTPEKLRETREINL